MRVLINTITAEQSRTGVGHYACELVRCLREQRGEGWLGTFPPPWLRRARACWTRTSADWSTASAPSTGWDRFRQTGRQQVTRLVRRIGQRLIRSSFCRAARRGGYGLYHEPNFIPFECDLPTAVTVHDLSVLLHPEWHPASRVAHFETHFLAGLRRCTHLFAISESGKREIVRHLGWPADRITVTYMGVRDGLRRVEGEELRRARAELGLPEGYLLHVGTLEPRKNVLLLLRAYCALPPRLRERHPLVLAGGGGWNSGEVHAFIHNEARHKNVRWLGYVEDRHFPALYSAARALLFPTIYEGFGMPTIEMMACGGAVLASTADAVAETVGDQAYLIDPRDEAGWRDAMQRVCEDTDWWQALRRGAVQKAGQFTWARCAATTADAYRRILTTAAPPTRAA